MARLRKRLPKDFEGLLTTGTLDELKAVFDKCDVNATGGIWETTALGFLDCPEALMRWLVENGADPNAGDRRYDRTPLYLRAQLGRARQIPLLLELGAELEHRSSGGTTALMVAAEFHQPETVAALLQAGADPGTVDNSGDRPLQAALRRARNADLPQTLAVARLLVGAGANTDDCAEQVQRIGKEFEFHRSQFNPDLIDETDAALTGLYELFDVPPVPARQVLDPSAPIKVPPGTTAEQFESLWQLLVPSQGAASTVQGEVIRIVARLNNEIGNNGAANWDRDYRSMLPAFHAHLGSGVPLPGAQLTEVAELFSGRPQFQLDYPDFDRLAELAISWIKLNPGPVELPKPSYRR